jgi:hypothetical protein
VQGVRERVGTRCSSWVRLPLRTFTARDGTTWSVWRIEATAPSEVLSVPRDWLMFQDDAGAERRRLVSFPPNWETLSDERLELLSKIAVPARGWGRPSPPGGTSSVDIEAESRSGG